MTSSIITSHSPVVVGLDNAVEFLDQFYLSGTLSHSQGDHYSTTELHSRPLDRETREIYVVYVEVMFMLLFTYVVHTKVIYVYFAEMMFTLLLFH